MLQMNISEFKSILMFYNDLTLISKTNHTFAKHKIIIFRFHRLFSVMNNFNRNTNNFWLLIISYKINCLN